MEINATHNEFTCNNFINGPTNKSFFFFAMIFGYFIFHCLVRSFVPHHGHHSAIAHNILERIWNVQRGVVKKLCAANAKKSFSGGARKTVSLVVHYLWMLWTSLQK